MGQHQRPILLSDLICSHVNKAPIRQAIFVMQLENLLVKLIEPAPCLLIFPS